MIERLFNYKNKLDNGDDVFYFDCNLLVTVAFYSAGTNIHKIKVNYKKEKITFYFSNDYHDYQTFQLLLSVGAMIDKPKKNLTNIEV